MNKVSSRNLKKTSTSKNGIRSVFFVELKLHNETYKAEGNNLVEAIEKIKPEIVKCEGTLKVKKGKLKAEIVLYPRFIKRLLVNGTYREIIAKRLGISMI